MRGLPVDHRLVPPPPVEVGADGRRELVDVGMHLLVFGGAPAEAPVLVFHVTVQGHKHRVDQLTHASHLSFF